MAISYEDWKTQYEWMTTDQQAKYAGMVKGNATAEEYANRYIQEKQNAGTFWQKTAKSYTNANPTVEQPTQTRRETPVVEQPKQETPVVVEERKPTPTRVETPVTTVSEIKQQWELKPLSQDYYNQTSEASQNKIISNLNSYKATNPEYFSDYDTFKRNFSYDARNDEQKNTLDVWYKWYSQGLELSGTPIADLYTQYKNWSISTTDLETLRVQNPGKYAELQAQINKGNIIAAYDDDNTTSTTMIDQLKNAYLQSMITNLNTAWSWAGSVFDDYQAKMESPEMMWLWDEAAKKQEEIEKVQADIDSMTKQVEAEYEGTWASRAKINAIVADRTYDLQLQLRSLNSEYNRVATQYNNRMNQYQNEFKLQLQEYQINMQEREYKMKELWFAMDLMSYETPQQQQEREWNYWVKQQEYQNGDINSKDYSTRYKAALKSVENLLAQYPGIPMVRSAEQMAEDIIKNIDANGTTLGQELSTINNFIKEKPEYKQLYNNTYGTGSSVIEDSFKSWNTEWVKYNNQWYTSDEFNKIFNKAWQAKPYDIVDEKVFSTAPVSKWYNTLSSFLMSVENKTKWGQCGKFVNDYLVHIWMTDNSNRYYDNELSTKVNSVNTQVPKVWSIAVFDYNTKSSDWINHGHVGIVTKVYWDGSFDVIDSNFSSDEKIQTRNIKQGSSSLKWFFDPSQPPLSTTTSTTQWEQNFVWGSIEWVPLTFERAVKNIVPSTLMNSDKELEALNTTIKNAYEWGIPQSEIALAFMWFSIKDDANKDLALDLVNTVRTLNSETQEWVIQVISDMINQWDYTKAVQTVENAVSSQAKQSDNYVSEASVKNTINRANELSNYISWLKSDPSWVVKWTMQEWLGRLSSSQTKEISNKIALLTQALDLKDKDLEGRIMPQLSDQPSVFTSKLNTLNNALMSQLNWWREIYWLPALDSNSLNNYSSRVSLYRNKTISYWFDEAGMDLKSEFWI